ncbi:uncharacterized protein [Nicotiana sylvestris]|uniref:uncharacterized protein n=1 Tax=Nicotiana sylvestris TaxID=4096 RepID=UPI00388C42BE
MNELSKSRVMIQGFNQRGKRAIGAIRLEITIEDMQSSAWLHVIDAKTSYNVLLGRPWIHENKVVPSTYHQCLKYYEGEVEKKIVADDEPFTEAESHFADAKFYLKNRIVKEIKDDGGMKSKNDEPITKRVEVTIGKAKGVTEEVHANVNKSHKGGIASYGKKVSQVLQYVPKRKKDEGESSTLQTKTLKELTLPVKRIEVVKLSSKPLAGFVTQNHWQNVVLPTKRTNEGFDPNAYTLFAKAGYNPDEPSKLGKLPSEAATRQPREVENGVPSSIEDNAELEDISLCYHISFNNGDPQEDEDAKDAPPELEEGVKTTVDALKEVNLGTNEEPRPIYISALLKVNERALILSYSRISGMPDLVPLIETEVNKLIEAGFICEVKYPTWVSSIVPVRKKNGQIRVCVDFRDLNNACPKDEFPLPIPELMIDATTGYEAMSFMDGLSGYNQIRMALKDEELTVFRTLKGIYCYKVMPFGLKNAGATYQRAMQNIFNDLLHKNVECYVDDLVVKSKEKGNHLKDLKMAIKGQALADFLADHPIPDDWELTDELPDEDAMVVEVQPPWKMYFDGSAHHGGTGAGVVFITSQGKVLPYYFTLTQLCSNNVAKYQTLILGLEMAVDMKQLQLQVFGDSQLVVNQLLGSYEVKKPELRPYHDYAKKLMGWLGDVTI